MSVVINTNYSATVASNNLAASNASLQKSLNRLSSGSKIVSPADDAGGLAVSMKLSAAAKRQGAVSSNIGNANSYLQTQDGALKIAGKVLDRISELKTLYNDPTKNASDKANYNSEFTALQAQLTSLGSEKFNGVALFGSNAMTVATTEDGSTSSAVTIQGINLITGGTSSSGGTTLLSDNFANLSNWSANGATVSGNTLNMTGGIETPATVQSFSGALDINFDYKVDSGSDNMLFKFGGSPVGSVMTPPDANYHHVRITLDGTGNANYYYDGATTPTSSFSGVPTSGQFQFSEVGFNTHAQNFSVATLATATPATGDLASVATASDLGTLNLSAVTSAIQNVATDRAQNGATQSRLGFANELLTTNKANLEAANSRIIDVDVASESTQLARFNTLVQAGTSMLSQANQTSQSALKLLS